MQVFIYCKITLRVSSVYRTYHQDVSSVYRTHYQEYNKL